MNRLAISKTLNVLAAALLIAYLIFGADWLLGIAVVICLGNAFESRLTAALARYWIRFGLFLGRINSRIILTILFFGVLTPLAYLYRLFNREKADHFLANKRQSYFDDARKTYRPEDFEKPW